MFSSTAKFIYPVYLFPFPPEKGAVIIIVFIIALLAYLGFRYMISQLK